MTPKETENEIVYRGDAARHERISGSAPHRARRTTSRRGMAFWLDWAPMLLLGLMVTLAGVYSLSAALSSPSTPVIVQTDQEAPPAANRPIQSAAPITDLDLRS